MEDQVQHEEVTQRSGSLTSSPTQEGEVQGGGGKGREGGAQDHPTLCILARTLRGGGVARQMQAPKGGAEPDAGVGEGPAAGGRCRVELRARSAPAEL